MGANFIIGKPSLHSVTPSHAIEKTPLFKQSWPEQTEMEMTIPIGIPTYAGMKTGFHAGVRPKNQFPHRCQAEKPVSMPMSGRKTGFHTDVRPKNRFPHRCQAEKLVSMLMSALKTGFHADVVPQKPVFMLA